MTTYNDTILLDYELNRISSIPIDYYIEHYAVTWRGYIFNDTTTNIDNCKIITTSTYNGVFSVSGGAITGYNLITDNLDTTCSLGTISGGNMLPIILNVYISGGLSGFHAAPLYITK